jgi:hypothetical protein
MVVMFVDCCVGGGRYFLYYSYRRNPTEKEFFIPAGTIAVKLLREWDSLSARRDCLVIARFVRLSDARVLLHKFQGPSVFFLFCSAQLIEPHGTLS